MNPKTPPTNAAAYVDGPETLALTPAEKRNSVPLQELLKRSHWQQQTASAGRAQGPQHGHEGGAPLKYPTGIADAVPAAMAPMSAKLKFATAVQNGVGSVKRRRWWMKTCLSF